MKSKEWITLTENDKKITLENNKKILVKHLPMRCIE
uniref:Uncharacterized protein n=1 Tax=Rhizophora mucronata TaxID=61149 RepID=A0A2P2PZP2_RHIMU